jgi:hypothetical protein
MINLIGELIIGAAAAMLADHAVKNTTGKHIHEHVFEWWCELRDTIRQWLNQFSNIPVQNVAIIVLDHLDEFAVRTKHMADRVTIGTYAMATDQETYEITEIELSKSDALRQFPQLAQTSVLNVSELVN